MIGRTADLDVYVGSPSAAYKLAHFLGGGITGATEITTAAYEETGVEDANVHSAGSTMSLTSMYDSANVSTWIAGLLGTNFASDGNMFLAIVEPSGDLEHWEAHPVDFSRPGRAAPANDAITRPWDFVGRDRGAYGFTVVPFTTNPGTAVTLVPATYDRGTDPVVWVIVTEVTAGATDLDLTDGTTNIDLNHSVGIQTADISATDAALTIDSTTQPITGIALVGNKMPLPQG